MGRRCGCDEKHTGFFENSRAAFLIIIMNVYVFYKVNSIGIPYERLQSFILSPQNIKEGNILSILTSGFIHNDIQHLVFNMLGVFIFGYIVEKKLGVVKTLFIYFGALILSLSVSMLIYMFILGKSVGIVGASGAVMGLLGAAVLLNPFSITYELLLPIPVMIKGWVFFYLDMKGFLGGEKDGVSHLAHIVGFLSIVFLIYFMSNKDKSRYQKGLWINISSLLLFIGLWAYYNQKLGGIL